jgi:hypothetical protein
VIESAEDYELLLDDDAGKVTNKFKTVAASEAAWREIINRYPQFRKTVALNITLPESIHRLLATDGDEDVRSTLADRRQLSPEVFEILAADVADSVRGRVCANQKTPEVLLVKLLDDPEPWIARMAQKKLEERRAKSSK